MEVIAPPSANPGCRRIPLDSLAFDIDGVVADIMTTFLSLVRERYDCGHHLRYEHITKFSLEDCLDLEPRIIAELIRELIDRPHQLAVEPFPQAVAVLTRLARETPLLFVTARDRAGPIRTWLHAPCLRCRPRISGWRPPVIPTANSITSGTKRSGSSWRIAWKPACFCPATGSLPSSSPNPGTAGPTRFWKWRTGPPWPAFSSGRSEEYEWGRDCR